MWCLIFTVYIEIAQKLRFFGEFYSYIWFALTGLCLVMTWPAPAWFSWFIFEFLCTLRLLSSLGSGYNSIYIIWEPHCVSLLRRAYSSSRRIVSCFYISPSNPWFRLCDGLALLHTLSFSKGTRIHVPSETIINVILLSREQWKCFTRKVLWKYLKTLREGNIIVFHLGSPTMRTWLPQPPTSQCQWLLVLLSRWTLGAGEDEHWRWGLLLRH